MLTCAVSCGAHPRIAQSAGRPERRAGGTAMRGGVAGRHTRSSPTSSGTSMRTEPSGNSSTWLAPKRSSYGSSSCSRRNAFSRTTWRAASPGQDRVRVGWRMPSRTPPGVQQAVGQDRVRIGWKAPPRAPPGRSRPSRSAAAPPRRPARGTWAGAAASPATGPQPPAERGRRVRGRQRAPVRAYARQERGHGVARRRTSLASSTGVLSVCWLARTTHAPGVALRAGRHCVHGT